MKTRYRVAIFCGMVLLGLIHAMIAPRAVQAADNAASPTISSPPAISGFWPGSGPVGTFVFVFGTNFLPGQTSVAVNAIPAPLVHVLDANLLIFMLPPGVTSGLIEVTTPYGSALSATNFGVPLTGLQITGVSPLQTEVGSMVFVFGNGFAGYGTKVSVNGVSTGVVQVIDTSMLIFMVPDGATTGYITVTTPSGSIISKQVLVVGHQLSINSTSQNTAAASAPVTQQPLSALWPYQVLAANDLGMHCTDLDFQIFSILPPFNVVHAQVVRKGNILSKPQLLNDSLIEVMYSAAGNPVDPALQRLPTTPVFKTNFWEINPATGNSLGFDAYDPLYPTGVLGLFPLLPDMGLPVPDLFELYLGGGTLRAGQQTMPGITVPFLANQRQRFDRFDADLPFFTRFPFGYVVSGANWFAADGIPIMPVDDSGRENAYPLMRVQALDKTGALTGQAGTVLDSTDVVLPVASEADCHTCHADPADGGNGAATVYASVKFPTITARYAPGPERLGNAAKINILRLHDAKHGAAYTSSIDGQATPCTAATNPGDPDCLANRTPLQCSWCHYTPALDLAHLGPIDEPQHGVNGRQQTRHISMSRAMHYHHGSLPPFNGAALFPEMPPPNDPSRLDPVTRKPVVNAFVQDVLDKTCYQCHPGKRTACLRGAMFAGGMVCQDCHGGMREVGDDFTANLASMPFPAGADLTKRVPWASEPRCQSCHTGDAVSNLTADADTLEAVDGIRLLQAFRSGDSSAQPIIATNKRFAENQNLYRLSTGHGGVACQNCHGSTHAIWPVKAPIGSPSGAIANDNLAAIQLQGHDGKIQECSVCHERDANGFLTMPLGLNGPHGMHPVNDPAWTRVHKNYRGTNSANCKACHGNNLLGTVLSTAAAERLFYNKNGDVITFRKGHQFGCGDCHRVPSP